jgi:hypothetical protein
MIEKIRRALQKLAANWAADGEFLQKIEQLKGEIRELSLEEAKAAAEAALSNPARFDRVEAHTPSSANMSELAPELRSFFERYARVASQGAFIAELDSQQIRPSAILSGYIAIGIHVEHTELAIKPGEEGIWVLADDVPSEEALEDFFPSVYHYLLFVDRFTIATEE